ncbi:MAG: hypothetical protein IJG37_04785, partial [Synergistaceae bacterium]|nr:hypothetical protein [Synergistaceae bacterium]
ADELAGEIQRLTYEREADISRSASTAEELRQDISRSREHTQELYEQLREESDNLAGEIQRQTLQRETDQDEAQARREHENERRQLREDHEQEQLAELSQAVISGQVSMMTDRAKTKQGLSELGDRISHWETRSLKAEERIYEGLSSLSGGLIRVGLWVKLAEDSRRNEMSRNRECFLRLGEMSAENAAGILKLREEVSREGVKSYDRIRGLQEQINELASLKLSDIQEQREMSDRLAVIESDMDAILSEIDPEYVSAEDEEIDDMIDRVLAGETVTGDGEYDDPEFDGMIDEIFGVNP